MAEDNTIDIASLTEDQQLALQQFTSVTDQELAKALPLLQRCEWNVQIAIARFFDGEPAVVEDAPVPPPVSAPSRTPQSLAHDLAAASYTRPPRGTRYEPAHRIASLPENQRIRSAPLILALFMAPLNFLYNLLSKVFSYIPIWPRVFERLAAARVRSGTSFLGGISSRRQLGSLDTSTRFLREFEETYGPNRLPFLRCGYGQAYDQAKRDLSYLVVVPISPEHDDTSEFISQVLLSTPVANFFNDPSNHALLWAGSIQDYEPYQVATSLSLSAFPATAIVAHTPTVSSTAMSVLKRIVGNLSADEYAAQLKATVVQHSAELDRVRAQRSEQQAVRSLREEQNSAYERSLATDRERARKKKEAEEEARRRESEAKTAADNAERREALLTQWKSWRATSIIPEPAVDDKSAVRVSIRLVDGERIIRRFSNEAPLEELYAFVACLAEIRQDSSEQTVKPEGYEHEYDFQLVTTLPREVHALADGGTIGSRLGRSANLIVEPVDHSEEDD